LGRFRLSPAAETTGRFCHLPDLPSVGVVPKAWHIHAQSTAAFPPARNSSMCTLETTE
jgi:hypothetical protein